MLPNPIYTDQPLTALAPMQDVTDLPFMRLMGQYGPPDYFFTEYFRVHAHSRLEPHILAAITDHGTGRPVFAQLIGNDVEHIRRTVRELRNYPVAGIDINLGCPAPKVYKKCAGGGLLREPERVDRIMGVVREESPTLFTVKTRIGFEDTRHFAAILELVNKHQADLLTVHGRTVKEMYRSGVHYDCIKQAVESVGCPVLANGDVSSVRKAYQVLEYTGAAGVMIGRHAIRNPWIFSQLQTALAKGDAAYKKPTLADVRQYIDDLWAVTEAPDLPEVNHVARMKKFLNFIGQGVDAEGAFMHAMRRTRTAEDLFSVCDQHLVDEGRATVPFADEPYEGIVARPNREAAVTS